MAPPHVGSVKVLFWSFIQSKVQEIHASPISPFSTSLKDRLLAVTAVTIICWQTRFSPNEIAGRMEAMMKITELPPPRLANEAPPTQ